MSLGERMWQKLAVSMVNGSQIQSWSLVAKQQG